MKDIILIGGGGHCKSVIDVIEQENKFSIIGILDSKDKIGQNVLGYNIIGTDDDIENFAKKHKNFAITIGQIKSPKIRKKIYNRVIKANGKLPVIISPLAYVSKHAKINYASIIMHSAIVNANSIIGKCVIINTKANIEHDVKVGNFCHISTGATLNGNVSVKNGVFIGSNTVVNHNIEIAKNSIIGSNSTVNKSITNAGTYAGCPIKKINNG
jgi:sugar O-acyltransferase (sialic acid O-acetyltransferase NeuD family)